MNDSREAFVVGKRFTIARYFYLALKTDSIHPGEDHTDIWNTEAL